MSYGPLVINCLHISALLHTPISTMDGPSLDLMPPTQWKGQVSTISAVSRGRKWKAQVQLLE